MNSALRRAIARRRENRLIGTVAVGVAMLVGLSFLVEGDHGVKREVPHSGPGIVQESSPVVTSDQRQLAQAQRR